MSTKEQILEISLDLMCQKGYDSVSIRDICKQVGIKESTIYYHYKNKNDILQSIIGKFILFTDNMMKVFDNAVLDNVTEEIFVSITSGFIEQYLLNDLVIKFVKLLMIEQNNNEEMKKIYLYYFFDMPIKFQKQIFSKLIKAQVFTDLNSKRLAEYYYSYIFFMYSKHIISQNVDTEKVDEFKALITNYAQDFYRIYGDGLNE